MRRILTLLCLLLLPISAFGQTFPDRVSETVNDFAGVLLPSEEVTLHDQLVALEADLGVEMTLVTLESLAPLANGASLEDYATALFNHWGIGDSRTNLGVMILQVSDQRRVRLELGSGYGDGWNGAAKRVIERSIVPAFADGDFGKGLVDGTADTIVSIIRPHLAGEDPPRNSGVPWIFGALLAGFVAFVGIRTWNKKYQACPQCGKRGTLHSVRRTLNAATERQNGSAEQTTTCTNCSYHARTMVVLPLTGPDPGPHNHGGGGGNSSGGGASGSY